MPITRWEKPCRLMTGALLLVSVFGCASVHLRLREREADLSALAGSGVFNADISGEPRGPDGVLKTFALKLPAFDEGVWFAMDNPLKWPAAANRAMPWVLNGNADNARRGGLFCLLKLRGEKYLALLPIACRDAISWLEPKDDSHVNLRVGTLGVERFEGERPVLAWSVSDNPYTACAEAWRRGLRAVGPQASPPRDRKEYPVMFRYLGWCSWERYHKKIDASVLLGVADALEKSEIPVRWMLVDDGHEALDGNGLKSFAPDRKKFPEAWKPLLEHRANGKLKWFGLWHCDQGYWGGLAVNNDFGKLNQSLERLPAGLYMPKPSGNDIGRFFDAYMKSVAEYGFDFVKIDNQAATLARYRGTANAVAAASEYAEARERAVRKFFGGALINCMAHNSVCAFDTRYSAITRCSVDYKAGAAEKGKRHIRQSFLNTLWIGQTVWPDHDMFHSSDPECGALMAVSKAVSGGPVCLSDEPSDIKGEFVSPLCYGDGELLRPEAPGFPLPDSICVDPINGNGCFRTVAPLPNQAAAVVLYNLRKGSGKSLVAVVKPEDYGWRRGMTPGFSGAEKTPREGLVAYDWREEKGWKFDETRKFELKGFSDKLVILCPIVKGWAVIGRADKYLSPAAVTDSSASDETLSVTLKTPGPLVVYSGRGQPKLKGVETISLGRGFFKFDIPREWKGPVEITR